MAENTVVKEQLTDLMIDAGAELTAKLDEIGLSITAALWLFAPELNEWRLVFASPEVGTKGPRKVYEQIARAVNELGEKAAAVPLSIIAVVESDGDLARMFKTAIRTGPGLSRIRFSKNVINGHFIDDALIYRAA